MTEQTRPVKTWDMWDMILLDHLHLGCTRRTSDKVGWLPAIPKSGIEWLMDEFVVWTVVACGIDFHRVGISRKGRIVLIDHPDWRRERAFGELGGQLPFCLKFFDVFDTRESWVDALPQDFYGYVQEQSSITRERARRRIGLRTVGPFHGGGGRSRRRCCGTERGVRNPHDINCPG